MPYLMGGFPDLDTSRAVGEACIDAGANLTLTGITLTGGGNAGPTGADGGEIHPTSVQR